MTTEERMTPADKTSEEVKNIDAQLALIKKLKNRRKRSIVVNLLTSIAMPLVFLACLLTIKDLLSSSVFIAFITIYFTLAFSSLAIVRHISEEEQAELEALVGTDDKRAIIPMFAYLGLSYPILFPRKKRMLFYNKLSHSLARLLLTVQKDDAELFQLSQRRSMYARLSFGAATDEKQAYLQIAIIHAIKEIGDIEAIRHIRQIANTKVRKPEQEPVCQAARDCLNALEQELAHKGLSETLLRPGAQPLPDSTLLRASSKTEETPPNQLLRPK